MKNKLKKGTDLTFKKERLINITPVKSTRMRGIPMDTTSQSTPDCYNW
jgi:hypothetical protein